MKTEKAIYTITYNADSKQFEMSGPGTIVIGQSPRILSATAFNAGADEVKHDYDMSELNEQGLHR